MQHNALWHGRVVAAHIPDARTYPMSAWRMARSGSTVRRSTMVRLVTALCAADSFIQYELIFLRRNSAAI